MRLCRHKASGGCSNFCQYKLFLKIVAGTALVLGVILAAVAIGTADGATRVRDAGFGVAAFLAVVIPLIAIESWRDPG